MTKRYERMMEFFSQKNNKEKEAYALKELQFVKSVDARMKFFENLDFRKFNENCLIVSAKKDIKYVKNKIIILGEKFISQYFNLVLKIEQTKINFNFFFLYIFI